MSHNTLTESNRQSEGRFQSGQRLLSEQSVDLPDHESQRTSTTLAPGQLALMATLNFKDEPNNSTIDVDTRLPSNRYLLVSQRQNSDLDNKYAELKNHLIQSDYARGPDPLSLSKLERKRKLKHANNQQYLNQ